MFVKTMFHRQNLGGRKNKCRSRRPPQGDRARTDEFCASRLLLPGALLVTIQTQLLAPFVLVNFCLAAFF
jgi:hypothetical protein